MDDKNIAEGEELTKPDKTEIDHEERHSPEAEKNIKMEMSDQLTQEGADFATTESEGTKMSSVSEQSESQQQCVNVEDQKHDGAPDDAASAGVAVPSNENQEEDSQQLSPSTSLPPEPVDVKIIYNKKKYDHTADLNNSILDLKKDIEKLTGVPVATQKVIFKGSTHDEQTLKQLKVSKSANKFMVIGSTVDDLLKIAAAPDPKLFSSTRSGKPTVSGKEPLCKQTAHKKVLDKHGKPDDVAVGMKGSSLPLPPTPLSGMYNKYGGKTRLTFKLDQDELWIGTKERTQKVKMGSIKDIVSQPIEGHEEYHLMGLQLGTTEASKYWIYWVPAQYVNAIKDTVLGKWGDF